MRLKLLRQEIRELRDMLIPEVQPAEDEVISIECTFSGNGGFSRI